MRFAVFALPASLSICVVGFGAYLLYPDAFQEYLRLASDAIAVPAKQERPFELWITNGYLISDGAIRLSWITKCNYFPNLTLLVDGYELAPVHVELLQRCPSWLKTCLYNGYYGNVNVPTEAAEAVLGGQKKMRIGYEDDDVVQWKAVTLLDSRAPTDKRKKHKLGVCLFPVIQLAHWAELVQFFEMWIEHGATKFYYVYQSMSKEVEAILRIYEKDSSIDIERVHWGEFALRSPNVSVEENPNGQIPRGEQVFAASECLLRSRRDVENVAVVDLDETFVVFSNETLIEVLDRLTNQWPTAGAFVFRSTYGVFDFQNVWANATHPSQLRFDIFDDIVLENRTMNAGQMSKLIVKPERIKVQGVHYVIKAENHSFFSRTVDLEAAKIFHLRLVKWVYAKANISSVSGALRRYTPGWSRRYAKRIADEEKRLQSSVTDNFLTLKDKVWAHIGVETMVELEKCHIQLMGNGRNECPSNYKCYGNLTKIKKDEWIYAEDRWVVL